MPPQYSPRRPPPLISAIVRHRSALRNTLHAFSHSHVHHYQMHYILFQYFKQKKKNDLFIKTRRKRLINSNRFSKLLSIRHQFQLFIYLSIIIIDKKTKYRLFETNLLLYIHELLRLEICTLNAKQNIKNIIIFESISYDSPGSTRPAGSLTINKSINH
jgi:hypothetical protein